MSARSLPVVSNDGSLAQYLHQIRQFPLLEPEEEYMLARRWRDDQNVDAAHKLVTSHLRLVAKMAMGYRHYGLPLADLISEGNVGLMRAVKKFDPEVGVRLATYAMWWIRAALQEYILASWSLVKVGSQAAQKKLFFSLRRLKAGLGVLESGDLDRDTVARIAKDLEVPEREVVEMNRRLLARDASLNAPVVEDQGAELQDLLVDDATDQETLLAAHQEGKLRRRLLSDAMETLNPRERDIVTERRLRDSPATLEELGRRYGVSRERIRQIEVAAFNKLQQAVLSANPAM
ncbi:MAG: RNA polymerase sigma factor RpoH [Rhodospirillales bacterium]|nr:RNA polymerase sigma factor RpoH [Rhodospirillales bacterium]